MEKLFVYGTLQPGGSNEHQLADIAGRWEPGRVRGHLLSEGWGANAGYPALIPDEQGPSVDGWLLSSSQLAAHWERLDAFEGEEYERCVVSVALQSGEVTQAHVYALRDRPRNDA